MTNFSRIVISRIVRKAKELSDEEVLSLYHQVKEKLESQKKPENQVLEGEHSGPTPQNEDRTSLVSEPAEQDGGTDKEIDDLLESLGLGETEAPTEEKTATAQPPETPPPVSPVAPTATPPSPVPAPAQEISETPPVVNQPIEAPATKPIGVNQVEVEPAPAPELPPEEGSTTEQPPVIPSLPEEKPAPEEAVRGNPEDEELFNRVTEKIMSDPQFDVSNFKTANRGFQVNRKDKDLMADDITKPKYKDPDVKPPRTDMRDPNGARYKKNEKDRDADTDSDPDLK